MFKRQAKYKARTAARNTDRRHLIAEIAARFGLDKDDETSVQRRAEVIEAGDLQVAKFINSHDATGVVYFLDQIPVWVRVEKSQGLVDGLLFPTLFTLWRLPWLVETIPTWEMVRERILGGADLMIPGIAKKSQIDLPRLGVGSLVAISMASGPFLGCDVAVGILEIDIMSTNLHTAKGKAVKILHNYQDTLWASSEHSPSPQRRVDVKATDNECEGDWELVSADGEASIETSIDQQADGVASSTHEELTVDCLNLEDDRKTTETPHMLSQAEIDDALFCAFLQALKTSYPMENRTFLPIAASAFYSAHIVPNRPAPPGPITETTSDLLNAYGEIDVKKSSYKKLAKWLKYLEKEGLLKTKEVSGDLRIVDLGWEHERTKNYNGHRLLSKAKTQLQSNTNDEVATTPDSDPHMRIQILYRLGKKADDSLTNLGFQWSEYYERADIQRLLTQYIKAEGLSSESDPRMIKLTPTLIHNLLTVEEKDYKVLFREEIIQRLLKHKDLQVYHRISHTSDDALLEMEPVKGHLHPVEISTQKRQGKKVVTTVRGLEDFAISPKELAEHLKKVCAASTTIQSVKGISPKQQKTEVLVQGPQVQQVKEYLKGKGVPNNWIATVDRKG